MKILIVVLLFCVLSGCANYKSTMGFHPGVLTDQDGNTVIYDTDDLNFLDHSDSFWHQLLLVEKGDSVFIPEDFIDNFLSVVVDENRFVDINEFDRREVKSLMIEKAISKKESLVGYFDNSVFVLEGIARFNDYSFEGNYYQLEQLMLNDGAQIVIPGDRSQYGKRRGISTYVKPAITPPVIEPVKSINPLSLDTVRTTDMFLSRLSRAPNEIYFQHDDKEAKELKSFYSNPQLNVSVVTEVVGITERPVPGVPHTLSSSLNSSRYLVFEHNVICYIFYDGAQVRTRYIEHSDVDNRSRDVCRAEVERLKNGKPLESANMRPSFDDFPDGAVNERGERAKSHMEGYF